MPLDSHVAVASVVGAPVIAWLTSATTVELAASSRSYRQTRAFVAVGNVGYPWAGSKVVRARVLLDVERVARRLEVVGLMDRRSDFAYRGLHRSSPRGGCRATLPSADSRPSVSFQMRPFMYGRSCPQLLGSGASSPRSAPPEAHRCRRGRRTRIVSVVRRVLDADELEHVVQVAPVLEYPLRAVGYRRARRRIAEVRRA